MGGRSTARLATLALAAVLITVPAIASVAASVPGVDEAPWGAWHIEQVAGTAYRDTDIALTPDGEVRVLADAGSEGVYVGHRSLTGWTTSTIEQKASTGGLAIADDGTEWVAYAASGQGLRLAHRSGVGEAWIKETVDDNGGADLALGPDGAPRLVCDYVTETSDIELRYTVRTGAAAFETETIASSGFSQLRFDDPAMTVDDQGRVHAVFVDRKSDEDPWTQRYALRDASGSWSSAWLDQCDSDPADIAVDLLDQAHVVCHAKGTGLGHYEQTANGWTFEAAATGDDVPPRGPGGVGYEPSIAIDAGGVVHATFRTGFNGFFPDDPTQPAQAHYAARDASSGAWSVEPVDDRGTGVGFEPSIGVDEDGRPHVAYVFAWRSGTAPCFGDGHPGEPINPCFALRYAEPVSATATGALDRAS